MQTITILTLLLVASQTVSAEQPQEVQQPGAQQAQPVEHHVVHHHQSPSGQVVVPQSSGQRSPVGVVGSEVSQPTVGVEHHVSHVDHVTSGVQPQAQPSQAQPSAVYHYAPGPVVGAHQPQVMSYYSPAVGMVQVVGQQDQQQHQQYPKPPQYSAGSVVAPTMQGGQAVANEQYGQPESASIPANYKPFGSWGLYIGGNPADGYYSSYYKSLANSVEKQVGAGGSQPAVESSGAVQPANRVAVRQASGSSYVVGGGSSDFYPFENSYYTPADLSSGVSRFVSPVQAGSQVYGTPSASFEPGSSMLSYAADNSYGTKRAASASQQQQQQQQQQQAKGYQTRSGYVYSPVVQASGVQMGAQQPQVVNYPVPVGSQIVGSQPGVDGAFQPYGVHAFTRYAVKPTVINGAPVAADQQAQHQFYSMSNGVFPSYKQMGANGQQQYGQYSMGFYGYPISQLHYAPSSVSPSSSVHQQVGSPSVVGGNYQQSPSEFQQQPPAMNVGHPFEVAASGKSETTSVSDQHPVEDFSMTAKRQTLKSNKPKE